MGKVVARKEVLFPLLLRMEELLAVSDTPDEYKQDLINVLERLEAVKESGKAFGVGFNDLPDENFTNSRAFSRWYSMLERCYAGNEVAYLDCTVCEEWLLYSNFKQWLLSHSNWEELHIDKDLLVPGNRVYSPETCCMISPALNSNLIEHPASKKGLPRGVKEKLQKQRWLHYRTAVRCHELNKNLYKDNKDPMVCHAFWQKVKVSNFKYLIKNEEDVRIIQAVNLIITKLERDIELGLETKSFYD